MIPDMYGLITITKKKKKKKEKKENRAYRIGAAKKEK